jgi:hypothetical protein
LKISREDTPIDGNLQCLKEKLDTLSPWMKIFENSHAFSKTHKLWKQYKEMILIFKQFSYSERSADMLIYLVARGHYNNGLV